MRWRRRIVCRVDEYRWRGAHPLEPAGAAGGGETRPHRVDVELSVRARTEERLDSGQRDHGVVCLMLAVQREEDLGVHASEALQFQQLTSYGNLPPQHRELGILARHRRVGAKSLRQKYFHRLGHLTAMTATVSVGRRSSSCLVMIPAFSAAISAMVSPR